MTWDVSPARRHRARTAATVNAVLVLAVVVIVDTLLDGPVANGRAGVTLGFAFPLAGLCGWRTWYHSERWASGPAPLTPIFEPAIVSLGFLIVVLGPGTARAPVAAPAYWIAYGVPAIATGLLLGVLLRAVAVAVIGAPRR